jgi:hypothetical protein
MLFVESQRGCPGLSDSRAASIKGVVMSEHIVHTGVLEDTVMLMPYLKSIPSDFVNAIQSHIGFARLGCITVSGDRFSFRLLEEYKPLWKNRDDLLEAKLAFVLGWVSHRACDRQMKPIWNIAEIVGRGSDADPSISPTEISVYHEATLYNLYYTDNAPFRLAIFPDQLASWPGGDLFRLPLAEEFVESSFAMNLMNNQTFPLPPQSTDQVFIENVCLKSQKFYVDINRYSRAARNPVPENKKDYVKDINWYNQNDEIIKFILFLRRGGIPDSAAVEKAVNARASCHYGQAVQLSLNYITAAVDYFKDDSMSMDTLKDRLDIGKKGPNGLAV